MSVLPSNLNSGVNGWLMREVKHTALNSQLNISIIIVKIFSTSYTLPKTHITAHQFILGEFVIIFIKTTNQQNKKMIFKFDVKLM
jgi:hypothetical protein